MIEAQIEYCGLVIKELFGSLPSRVFEFIARHQPVPLKKILTRGKFAEKEVKKSLWILIQQHLVNILSIKPGTTSYGINLKNALQRARHVRYIYIAQCLYGEEGKALVEQVSKHGKADLNGIIEELSKPLKDGSSHDKKDTYEKFCQMSQADFIIQHIPMNISAPTEGKVEENPLTKNKRKMEGKYDASDAAVKRLKLEDDDDNGPTVTGLWKLNIDKFNECWKRQILIKAIITRIDEKAGDVLKALLKLSELPQHRSASSSVITDGITYNEMINYFRKQSSPVQLEPILRVLTQDSVHFVIKDGESDGGVYRVDFKRAFAGLCEAHVHSVIQERYGTKYLRIFRLVQMKKVFDQKQIEDAVMMDVKDTREYLFRLLKDGFLCQPEVSRSADYNPGKTYYFFSVNLVKVAEMLLQECYKAAANLMRRHECEAQINKRVVDKQRYAECLLEQFGDDDEQRAELEELLTAAEKSQLAVHIKASDVIEKAEMQLDETLFVLETYLSMH